MFEIDFLQLDIYEIVRYRNINQVDLPSLKKFYLIDTLYLSYLKIYSQITKFLAFELYHNRFFRHEIYCKVQAQQYTYQKIS